MIVPGVAARDETRCAVAQPRTANRGVDVK